MITHKSFQDKKAAPFIYAMRAMRKLMIACFAIKMSRPNTFTQGAVQILMPHILRHGVGIGMVQGSLFTTSAGSLGNGKMFNVKAVESP